MSLEQILQHRRAIRYYDAQQPISADRVEKCLKLASLAPTSSNMQLWKAHHITDPAVIQQFQPALDNPPSALPNSWSSSP